MTRVLYVFLCLFPYGLKQSFSVSNYSINIYCCKCNVIRMNIQILAQAVGCIQSCFLSMLTDRFVFIKAWILISTCSRPRIRPNITLSTDDRGKNRVSLSWAAVHTSHKVRAKLTHSVQESLRSRSFRNQRKEIQSGLFHSYFKMRHLTWETDQKLHLLMNRFRFTVYFVSCSIPALNFIYNLLESCHGCVWSGTVYQCFFL